ncbi:MAG: hypothetical protein IPM74_14750 [Crocinitomicaceae bacterium]|nr:hypothetical protein [Crocinitomicaceae bacterium]MBK8927130.1 hypothetical protein [Crocinitomicaceae bacterium]
MSTKSNLRFFILPLITVAMFFLGGHVESTHTNHTVKQHNEFYLVLHYQSTNPFDQPFKTHKDEEITSIEDERTDDDDVRSFGLCHVFTGLVHDSKKQAQHADKLIEYRHAFHVIPVYLLNRTLLI